ncbi:MULTISPECIES: hypothetical protein [Variovorax]|jgi:hypothetical protein|uniref:hypothetical protein n=1 Tax=Variovorax TaxID=34072 RepID=UPI00086A1C9B|nr:MULTISPECIES: hypothetical protein [Variovorax]MBN8753449.1 hypothetical protein [Variovorax sp.]ODU15733.1 MAG: hypothetical protein ABS94_17175 [Variovorax sp. SCN 67-85]ODV27593.1 MAG: hypothetical protein ABT25_01745 [Variovorax sp. SCN 67-20]OJZ11477.1 MAG: hypothetical protein BGP22_09080 [Variovorax sp. 67-131]UKI05876.1 hypothetical protein L3V85_24000 [Variovorax paradoxus]
MILLKTEAGHQALKDRSVPLSPRQRSAFILFDGKRSVDDVLAAGMGIAREDIDQMISLGVLAPVGGKAVEPVAAGAPAVEEPKPAAGGSGRSKQQRYKDAYPIATQLTGSLGLMGFRLNLQVEGTTSYDDLAALAPKIRAAVGPEKAAALDKALDD